MKYLKIKSIHIPLYGSNFVIISSNSSKKISKIVEGYKRKDPYATTAEGNYDGKRAVFVILNFDNKYAKIDYGVIAHECLHATHMIAEDKGIIPDFQNDEPLAYLLMWMVNEVHQFINDNNIKL